ncbi:MAG: general secretion pathway protein GspB [Candidatus Omnitrophota bacterium]
MKLSLPRIEMNKLQHSPLILVVWVIFGFSLSAFVFSLVARSSSSSSKKAQPSVQKVPDVVAVAEPDQVLANVLESQEPVLSEPEPAMPAEVPAFSLEGIIYSEQGQGSVALINGKVVPEGGLVKGARVEKITPETVELSFEGTPITLRSR